MYSNMQILYTTDTKIVVVFSQVSILLIHFDDLNEITTDLCASLLINVDMYVLIRASLRVDNAI